MILGSVNEKAPRLSLILRGFYDEETQLDFVVDTGFDGFLSVPLAVIQALNLLKADEADVTLADGTSITEDLYTAVVVWDGVEQMVSTAASEGDPVVGMGLMQGYNLSVDVTEGGTVRLSRLGGELETVQTDLESST